LESLHTGLLQPCYATGLKALVLCQGKIFLDRSLRSRVFNWGSLERGARKRQSGVPLVIWSVFSLEYSSKKLLFVYMLRETNGSASCLSG